MLSIGKMFHRELTEHLILRCAVPSDARSMADLQRRVFPTLSAAELLTEEHFRRHIEVFPQGQLVITYCSRLIASTSTFRCAYPAADHTFLGITGDRLLGTHDPSGEWLYGFDMGVDPALQGLGLGRYLYAARQEIARTFKLQGQVIVGMPSGYGKCSATVPFEEYYRQLLCSEVFDPTVSIQMKLGFEPQAVIANHLQDPKCGNYGIMMNLPVTKLVAAPALAGETLEAQIAQRLGDRAGALIAAVEVSRTEAPEPLHPEAAAPTQQISANSGE